MTDPLRQRAKALRLYGILAHWTEIGETSWLPTLVQWEEEEQIRRSLERRVKGARLGRLARFRQDCLEDQKPRCIEGPRVAQLQQPGAGGVERRDFEQQTAAQVLKPCRVIAQGEQARMDPDA